MLNDYKPQKYQIMKKPEYFFSLKGGGGKYYLILLLFFYSIVSFSQPGQKWATGGNTIDNSDFLGTTNNMHLKIKTNDILRVKIFDSGKVLIKDSLEVKKALITKKIFAPYNKKIKFYTNNDLRLKIYENGTIQIKDSLNLNGDLSVDKSIHFYGFKDNGNGLLLFDNQGKINSLKFNDDTSTYLQGDGSFGTINTDDADWKVDGNNMFNLNSGNVGIGLNHPQAMIDVNGNSIIRGTLTVYNGIIVGKKYEGEKAELDTIKSKTAEVDTISTEKMNTKKIRADKEVKTNTIYIDGINSRILSTTGTIDFSNENLKTTGSLDIGDLNVSGISKFDFVKVNNMVQIGTNTLYLGPTGPGSDNSIYSDSDILIQSESGYNGNTIINANQTGFTCIGGDPANAGTSWYDGGSRKKLDVRGDGRFTHHSDPSQYVRIGYNGANAILDSWSGTSDGKLLINYYSGKDVVVGGAGGQYPNTGDFITRHNTNLAVADGSVGIGTSTPQVNMHLFGETCVGCVNPQPKSTVFRIEDRSVDASGTFLGDGYWDFIVSGVQKTNLYFQSGNANNPNESILTLSQDRKVGVNTETIYEAFQIGDDWTFHQGGSYIIGRNFKYSSGEPKRIKSGPASIINFNSNGDIEMKTVEAGSANSTISGWNRGFIIKNNGIIGIGTSDPGNYVGAGDVKLDVIGGHGNFGKIINGEHNFVRLGYNGANCIIDAYDKYDNQGGNGALLINWYSGRDVVVGGGAPNISTGDFKTRYNTYLCTEDGAVGIGTANTQGYKLAVKGSSGIIAEEVTIKLHSNWPDYVFTDDYELESLENLREFIYKNKHLPGVPNKKEVQKNGIKVKELNKILLEKIEELTLYTIDQQELINQLQESNNDLQERIKNLENK